MTAAERPGGLTITKHNAWDAITLPDMQAFARRDDCLDAMVPSDLRQIIGRYAEAIEVLRPFASIADRVLAEAPAEAMEYTIFTDCDGCKHVISLSGFRDATAVIAKAEGRAILAQEGE